MALLAALLSSCGGGGTSGTAATGATATPASVQNSITSGPAANATATPMAASASDAAGGAAPAAQAASELPFVNTAAIPASLPGFTVDQVAPTNEVAPDSDIGAFRTTCTLSHMSFDDPIVYPGQPGKSHLHAFFGNTGTNADSTPASILTTGDSTCRGGTVNRSAYWVPVIIDTTDGTPLVPLSNEPYYKTGYAVPAQYIQPMPQGLRMLSGDPNASAPQENIGWHCDTSDGGHFDGASMPSNCKAGTGLLMTVDFPQCWDGVNLDSPDHKSHMAFSNWQAYVTQAQIDASGQPQQWYQVLSPTQGCPPTHPVALPMIQFNVWYQVPSDHPEQVAKWRLSSDNYDTGKPGGYSAHGDWFNGWKKDISDAWALNCDRAKKDCHSHLLGDGRMIY